MNAEQVSRFYRAYKAFYGTSGYDIFKYHGRIRTPPLIEQPERRFYYRIAQKLSDSQIHALFALGFFFQPKAYVAELATEDAFRAAVAFASRGENGRPLLERDIYAWIQHMRTVDVDAWLYGQRMTGMTRSIMPDCLQEVIQGHLAVDIACLLLLIPQPQYQFNWCEYWAHRPEGITGLGAAPWIDRLKKLDRIIRAMRPGWRMMSHELAKHAWASLPIQSLAPTAVPQEDTLFA